MVPPLSLAISWEMNPKSQSITLQLNHLQRRDSNMGTASSLLHVDERIVITTSYQTFFCEACENGVSFILLSINLGKP